ncbi:MAG TPA: low specificity L-threonine aldolase [Coriobacteriia bacterium]|nr:low specificity L-threonine aldolase [Coriobacteriia bacterium]
MALSRGFGSDNHAGAHPEVLATMLAAGAGHVPAYGDDPWTARAKEVLATHLGEDCDIAFVFNGTGANCVCFAALCRPWESVICPESAHVNEDECGAPEHIAGVKLVTVATPDGKLTPELVAPHLRGFGFEHQAQPRVISVSNVTEHGTVYTPAELRRLADLAHDNNMLLHVDGARISNAAAALGCSLSDLSVNAGVDALVLGGTKNGMVFGEAVVLFGDARADYLPYVRKQSAQLCSKMRFLSAQYIAMFEADLWLRCAGHANEMARLLSDGARERDIALAFEPQANEVFAYLPGERVPELQERFHFYTWDETPDAGGRLLVRWVTSWDTEAEDVEALLAEL